MKIDNEFSLLKDVTSGVPQGSVLGPVFFIIFIKEITDILLPELRAKFYADDLNSYMSCTDINSANNYNISKFSGRYFRVVQRLATSHFYQ